MMTEKKKRKNPLWHMILFFAASAVLVPCIVFTAADMMSAPSAKEAAAEAEESAPDAEPAAVKEDIQIRAHMGHLEWYDGEKWMVYEDAARLMESDPFYEVDAAVLSEPAVFPQDRVEGDIEQPRKSGSSSSGQSSSSAATPSAPAASVSETPPPAAEAPAAVPEEPSGADGQDISAGDL